MAATSTTNLTGLMAQAYNRENYSIHYERTLAKFHDRCKSFTSGGPPVGTSIKWSVRTLDPHAVGTVGDGGDFAAYRQPQNIQPYVNGIGVTASLNITEQAILQMTNQGVVGAPNVLADAISACHRDYYGYLNKLSLGHGTGRLAVVESTTDTLTTFVGGVSTATVGPGVQQLRRNFNIDFYDTDTSGSKQGNSQLITAIAQGTSRTVTIDAARTLTAGWGVYMAGSYGVAPFGLMAHADDGTLTATWCNITRATYPSINAYVGSPSGTGTQAYSEKLLASACEYVMNNVEAETTEIWMNAGIFREHINSLTGSRLFTIAPGQSVPGYKTGNEASDQVGFQWNGKFIPFMVERDMPPRTIVGGDFTGFRKYVLREPSWSGDGISASGQDTPYLLQQPASTAANFYAFSKIAAMLGILNYGHQNPAALWRLSGVSDELLAGDQAVS